MTLLSLDRLVDDKFSIIAQNLLLFTVVFSLDLILLPPLLTRAVDSLKPSIISYLTFRWRKRGRGGLYDDLWASYGCLTGNAILSRTDIAI